LVKKARIKKLREKLDYTDFKSVRIRLASPEQIRGWSYGEVKKPETINYRTFKPEWDGLFCERIFGPVKDYECSCGKYKWSKHKGIICDRCGVEVTESKVRRERMGHIELEVPVAHIWFLRKPPSRIGMLLGMKLGDLERIIYYAAYVVTDPGKVPGLFKKQLLSQEEYERYKTEYGEKAFKAEIGAGAIKTLLKEVDLVKMAEDLRTRIKEEIAQTTRTRMVRQLRIIDGFIKSGNRPEWTVFDCIPIIPPDLRPLVPLEGGRFASSDLNDLYRRIINRNNRLRHIENLKAPAVMIHSEKRLLQEAVDALFENGARGKTVNGAGNRPLKSLSDILKGKQGRFRQNLLGKRVDYSGRSVIVVGPHLKLHQCGLPKEMALELFKPFILNELIAQGHVTTLKSAKKELEKRTPVVFDILEKVIHDHPVLLNRAPTLHRLGIQAFQPILVEGKAIQLHPLVCAAFNADFDGDQMAVHVPLSAEACLEAKVLMSAANNILSPANGQSIVTPTQDIVLGCCYLTKEKKGVKGEGRIFTSVDEVTVAYEEGEVGLHARIKVRGINKIREREDWTKEDFINPDRWEDYTTVGRILFNQVIPEELGFVNTVIDKKSLADLIQKCFHRLGNYRTLTLLDEIKALGFKYVTKSGITISVDDMRTPQIKEQLLESARAQVKKIESNYKQGLITEAERYNNIIDIWTSVTNKIADTMFMELKNQGLEVAKKGSPKFNSIYLMAESGARGSVQQIRQLAGMRGLMARPEKRITGKVGEIIESPIESNFREGLTVLEYFISTHGGRKGLADTALKTADAGYLTRRLIDVAHNVVIGEDDCGTMNGVRVSELKEGDEVIESLTERIIGRMSIDRVAHPLTDEVVVEAGEIITPEIAKKIQKADIERIRIRSVLTCESTNGICSKCYGIDMTTGRLAEIGLAVGIVAAQSIGEPGTQLTLRTFHIGGTATGPVKKSSIAAKDDGMIRCHNIRTIKNKQEQLIVVSRNGEISVKPLKGQSKEQYQLVPYGARVKVKENRKVKKGELIAEWDPYSMPIISEVSGRVRLEDIIDGVSLHEEINRNTGLKERVIIPYRSEKLRPRIEVVDKNRKKLGTYLLPVDTHLVVEDGVEVSQGDVLAKIPQVDYKPRDITGGLPRISDLFEARNPKNSAVISEISGVVKLGTTKKGAFKVTVIPDAGEPKEYPIPPDRHLVVYEGDRVAEAAPLTDGPINPRDILRVKGDKEVQEYLVNEIQEVYRLQGVRINDKHIEAIVRQMLSNVRIEESGDSGFLVGETVKKAKVIEENKKIRAKGGKPIQYRPVLLGVTKAALSSDSFISAASFQETTRVLTNASLSGEVDNLQGLKENVIIGRLIPAGTGMVNYQKLLGT